MKEHLRRGTVMGMDETTMQVMREDGRENTQKSYMWLARGGPPDAPVVIYEYHPTRAADNINSFLTGFSGHLQTDGYEGYDSILSSHEDIIHVGCMAHARRKFFEAHKVSKSKTALLAISKIKGLYTIESALREELKQNKITPEEFLERRMEKAVPILNDFHAWLEKQALELPDSSKTAAAVSYTLKQWPKLRRYLDSAELTPDNNACEQLIRPFVIGRKNWLLSGSPDGAASSCALYSMIESAKLNKVNPYEYLNRIFTLAATMNPSDDWSALLPWNIKL
jgi:transposase